MLTSCNSTPDDLDGELSIVNGQETDTWTLSPAPQTIEVDLVGTMRTTVTTVNAPTSEINLGLGTPAEEIAAFDVTGYDANNDAVIHGTTVPYSITTFANAAPVVFVGRTGGISRPPGNLLFEYQHPLTEVVGHAYMIVAGGDLASATQNPIDLYDMGGWDVAPQQTWLASVPQSWAVAVTAWTLLVVNDDGASSIDLTTGTASAVTAPANFDFANVVNGKTFAAPDDTRYIVGATRTTGAATDSVLRVGADGTLSALTLTAPRLGATAGFVNGLFVIAGGSDTAAGAEMLNAAGTEFVALDYPPDANQGAALAQLDTSTALLVGGADSSGASAGLRTLDITCNASCTTTSLTKLDFPFTNAQAFWLADDSLVLSGDSADNQTHVFTLTKPDDFALTEVALRTPRTKASLAQFPNGQVGAVGGDAVADGSPATTLEAYFPPFSK